MLNKKHPGVTRAVIILTVAIAMTIIGTTVGLLWPPLLTKAGATLPPRDEPPSQSDDDDDSDRDSDPVGAYIVLQVGAAPAGAWGVVQWLGADGNWHDVEGWQGPVQVSNRWWVAAKDFNTGPFRWAVNSGPGGEQLGTSESFTLPQFPNETLSVRVSLSN
ncbi:MAG: hypothetical protein KDJ65_26035 [Anaerolineae bacterium]|nr:hypothetical protein [Anaerolineae bacterium]